MRRPSRSRARLTSDWYRSITKLWHDHDDHSVDGLFAWETATQHQTMIFGSPARVRAQMGQLIEDSGCNYVICSFAWGTLPHQQTLRLLAPVRARGDAKASRPRQASEMKSRQ